MTKKNITKNIPSDEQMALIDSSLRELFDRAKNKDEAEYICAVKYFKGFNNLHVKTPVNELYETVSKSMDFSQTYLKDPNFVAKHLSFVYCQIFETENWLDLIFNLLTILEGKCVSASPFKKIINKNKTETGLDNIISITESDKTTEEKIRLIQPVINSVTNPNTAIITKVKKIKKLSTKCDTKIGDVLSQLYYNDFRNDFTHSQFVIYKNHLNLFKANQNIGFDSLFSIVLSVLNLFLLTVNLVEEEIEDIVNKTSKTFKGKCGTVTVEIDGDNLRQSSEMLCANF